MQSAGLTSLNHDIMASYPLRLTQISKIWAHPQPVYPCKAASILCDEGWGTE